MEKIKKKNSYFNSAGTWAQRVGLLPYDHVKKMLKDRDSRAICLVEGVRDPLRLIQEGIPALSILGSGMWSKQKLSLIMSLDPSHVFILMDGDEEGRKTSKQIAIDLKATGIPCTKLGLSRLSEKLDRKIDPANMPRKIVRQIEKRMEAV
jgi:5S rRNA maturation endonuclease (ribonuclease M5)